MELPSPEQRPSQLLKHAITVCLAMMIAVGAGFSYAQALQERPMHHDEANQAVKFGDLLEGNGYRYDPKGHHGPILYYSTLPVARIHNIQTLAECSERTLRAVPLVATAGLILLIGLSFPILGHTQALLAALLAAISSPIAFYSTYYIQEPLLVFFSATALLSLGLFVRYRRRGWLCLSGLGTGLAIASKETWILSAVAACCMSPRMWQSATFRRSSFRRGWLSNGGRLFILVALIPALLFYTQFGTAPAGIADVVRGIFFGAVQTRDPAYARHWGAYLQGLAWHHPAANMLWTELPILLLAVLGAILAFRPIRRCPRRQAYANRSLALYSIVLLALYSAIQYKTPWCLLNFWAPILVLAAFPIAIFLRESRGWAKIAVACGLSLLAFQQISQTMRTCTTACSDPRNPYVYSQTSKDFLKLVRRIDDITAFQPEQAQSILVCSSHQDAWPLPWHLRKRQDVRYMTALPRSLPANQMPAFLITTLEFDDAHPVCQFYQWELYQLRPGTFMNLGIRQPLWENWLQSRQ